MKTLLGIAISVFILYCLFNILSFILGVIGDDLELFGTLIPGAIVIYIIYAIAKKM